MSIEKIFCTTREAAILLGVSVGTAQLWVDNGLLTAWKTPGGHRRVTRESIDKLLHMKAALPVTISAEAGGAQMKVLIVEDSSNLRRLYEIVLAQWPMSPRITTVDNGIEAVMLLEQEHPDLLVVDLDTPGIDGFRLVAILKKNQKYADITIVVVSGLDEADILKRGGVPQDVFVLRKPVPFAKLLAIASGIEDGRKAGASSSEP
jgi:excisionase family DNA binding protein